MKSFLTIFFTRPAKTVYMIVILVLSIFVGECQVKYFEYFTTDKESFINAMAQVDFFEYEKSYYFKNTVMDAVNGVVKLAMEYPEAFALGKTDRELLEHFDEIGDRSFSRIIDQLRKIKGFQFAVVNHDKNTVYSNIGEINGASSGENIRKYFGESGKNLLIARSCKNPYFATNSYIGFAEDIRDCAEEYQNNFDLYIKFGTVEDFDARAQECRQLHFEMRDKIEKLNDILILCIALIVATAIIMLIVTGKHEPKGKTYLSAMNRIPNDLIIVIYGFVLNSIVALYRTSATVVINHGIELDNLWFMHSEDFYILRTRYCVVIFVCVVINLICLLKRSYKTGTLLSNTYIYPMLQNLKKRYFKKDTEEKATENS